MAFSRVFFEELANLADSACLIFHLDQVPGEAEANPPSDVRTQGLYKPFYWEVCSDCGLP